MHESIIASRYMHHTRARDKCTRTHARTKAPCMVKKCNTCMRARTQTYALISLMHAYMQSRRNTHTPLRHAAHDTHAHTHTQAHTRAHTHARTHTHACTQTHARIPINIGLAGVLLMSDHFGRCPARGAAAKGKFNTTETEIP